MEEVGILALLKGGGAESRKGPVKAFVTSMGLISKDRSHVSIGVLTRGNQAGSLIGGNGEMGPLTLTGDFH